MRGKGNEIRITEGIISNGGWSGSSLSSTTAEFCSATQLHSLVRQSDLCSESQMTLLVELHGRIVTASALASVHTVTGGDGANGVAKW